MQDYSIRIYPEHQKKWKDLLFLLSENIFSIIFISEFILKNIGMGFKDYLKDWWNVIDFIVVITA